MLPDSNKYRVDLTAVSSGYDRRTCWTQARAGVIPAASQGETPTIVLTMQKLRLHGSDAYEAIHSLDTTDLGRNWSTPVAQPGFGRERLHLNDGKTVERTVCDFTPAWHEATSKLLGTGHSVYYEGDRIMSDRPRETPYSIYDPSTRQWSRPKTLAMPDTVTFFNSGAGCTQRVDLPNGEILLPIYFKIGDPYQLAATVVRCGFDGQTLEYIEHGTELTTSVPRGFGEPSLVRHQGRFFLTLRNDRAAFVATSEDGLTFGEPKTWRFDNGEELGSYNTQQHWVTRGDDLFLVYTRRGLENDHVFRHRAPLVMAQVDADRLCILRETEREIIPNRGARLGNFGVTKVSENESWVTETEWMQNSGEAAQTMLQKLREKLPEDEVENLAATPYFCGACEQFGSDNTVWAARLLW